MQDRLSAWLPAYRLDLRAALQAAADQRYRRVHASALTGDLQPDQFSRSARRHLRKVLNDLGLQLEGLAAEFPGGGLADPLQAEHRAEQLQQTLELCADLGVRRSAVNIVGAGRDSAEAGLSAEMLAVVAELADRFGVETAVQDPVSTPGELAKRLRALGCPSLRTALDTAALAGRAEQADEATGLIGALYLRDVQRRGERIEETPFGYGEVDFPHVLALPDAVEQRASLIVRPELAGGVDALRQGREYITSLYNRNARG